MPAEYIGSYLPDEAIQVCMADMDHQIKYAGRSKPGKTAFLPKSDVVDTTAPMSPVEAVQAGMEPMAYLDKFRHDSAWYFENQEYKASLIDIEHNAPGM